MTADETAPEKDDPAQDDPAQGNSPQGDSGQHNEDPATDEALDPKKRGLGRGLSALFDDDEDEFGDFDDGALAQRMSLGIDRLIPGTYQPRRHIDEDSIEELAESIAAHGILQPLIVRPRSDNDDYEIIAGERRWRAAQRAQLHDVPVIIVDLGDEEALEIALIENLQRENLNPVEEAQGYNRLMEEFGHTQEKLAAALGKSRSHIANMVRLLTLPASVQDYLRSGALSMGHARALITADDPASLARDVVNKRLSVRETERFAAGADSRPKPEKSKPAKPSKDVDTLALEEEISNALGMAVSIDMKTGGGGALKVKFKTLDQLDEVLHRLSHFPGRQQTG